MLMDRAAATMAAFCFYPPHCIAARFFSLMKRALSDSNYFRTIGEVTSLYPAGIWKLLRSTGAVEKFPVSV
jgi:hypothetical protein